MREDDPKIEKELSYQGKYEMVRELDLKNIEDYKFYHPAEACPDLKEYFKEMHTDPIKGLISFTEKFIYHNTERAEYDMKNEVGHAIHPVPNLEAVKKHGYFAATTIYPHYVIESTERTSESKSLHDALGLEPNLENIKKITEDMDINNSDPSPFKKLSDKIKSSFGKVIYSPVGFYNYIFPSGKEYKSRSRSDEFFPKIIFNYKGHEFEIRSSAFLSNEEDRDLPHRPDNKLGLSRTSRLKLYIDGEEYEELGYDPKFKRKAYPNNTFLSWRKWCDLEDLVAGPVK